MYLKQEWVLRLHNFWDKRKKIKQKYIIGGSVRTADNIKFFLDDILQIGVISCNNYAHYYRYKTKLSASISD